MVLLIKHSPFFPLPKKATFLNILAHLRRSFSGGAFYYQLFICILGLKTYCPKGQSGLLFALLHCCSGWGFTKACAESNKPRGFSAPSPYGSAPHSPCNRLCLESQGTFQNGFGKDLSPKGVTSVAPFASLCMFHSHVGLFTSQPFFLYFSNLIREEHKNTKSDQIRSETHLPTLFLTVITRHTSGAWMLLPTLIIAPTPHPAMGI